MVLASEKESCYDFIIENFLVSRAIKGEKILRELYTGAISEARDILNGKTDYYKISGRTLEIVSLLTLKYSKPLLEKEDFSLSDLSRILEENHGKKKL